MTSQVTDQTQSEAPTEEAQEPAAENEEATAPNPGDGSDEPASEEKAE